MQRRSVGGASRSAAVKPSDGSEFLGIMLFGTNQQIGSSPAGGALPPLAEAVATRLGPTGCARLASCGRACLALTPYGLHQSPRQRWVKGTWACSEVVQRGLLGTSSLPEVTSSVLDEVWSLVASEPDIPLRRDPWGMTPLHNAAKTGHSALCRLLIDARASVNIANARDGRTPLHCAAGFGHASCTRLLLHSRADPRCQDERLRTPLAFAVRSGPADAADATERMEVQDILTAAMSGAGGGSCLLL
mmetsp:Transcript_40656/g.91308  ORF Transcript_40656/g.91308 Transcript_40656/m.91308 type:complete len:247 (-) Transcript_40656:30-770(-)